MTDTVLSFFKVQESQPKTKTHHSRNCIFFKTLLINYCRSSKSLSKCKCCSSIYTNLLIPKLPFQILTTASALLQLSIIYMSTTSLKTFSLSSFFFFANPLSIIVILLNPLDSSRKLLISCELSLLYCELL